MPQDIEFDIPIPPRVSPHLSWVRARTLAWVREHDLIRSDEAEQEFISWDLTTAAARTYPNAATREDLLKMANFFAMGFLFDDQADYGYSARVDRALQVAHEMVMIPLRPLNAPLEVICPATLAWRELWERMTDEMSPVWCNRFAVSYGQFLAAHAYETRLSAQGHILDVASYIALRRVTVGIFYCLDQTEWAGRYELAPHVLAHPLLRKLRESVVDTVAWMNDIHSVEREAAHHDPHNLLLVLRHHRVLSHADALDKAESMTYEAMHRFLRLRDQLPAMVEDLRLDDTQRQAVHESVAGMENWIRGNYDWARTTGRYRATGKGPAYAEDVISEAVTASAVRLAG